MSLLDLLNDPPETQQQYGLQKPFKTADDAYRQDVAPRAQQQSSGSLLDLLGPAPAQVEPASPAPAKTAAKPSSSNFGRGWDVSGKQLKQTAYGTAALIGDTFGSDSLKKWGLQGYKDAEKEIQAISKESDSFTSAVQSGDIGSWLTYSAGYLAGQFADLAVASAAGAVVGGSLSGPAAPAGAAAGAVTGAINKAAVQTGLRGAVGKMIDKEAASLTAAYIERGMVKEAAERAAAEAAVKSVYRTIGATTANTFLNATGELGSIYGEAVEEAAKTGQEYSLGKIWLSGIAATAVDTWADSKAVKGLTDAFKGKNRVSSIAMEAFKGGMREGLTEGTQTVIERWGADKDLTSKEAFKEYIDSAAVGVLGGTAAGGASGAVSKLQANTGKPEVDQTQANFTKLPESQSGRTRPLDEADTPAMPQGEMLQTLSNPGFVAALYQQSDDAGKQVLRDAVERAGFQEAFGKALQDPDQIAYGAKMIQNNPDFVPTFVQAVEQFATTQSPAGVFKADKRGAKPQASQEEEFDQRAQQEGFTLKEKPASSSGAQDDPSGRDKIGGKSASIEEAISPNQVERAQDAVIGRGPQVFRTIGAVKPGDVIVTNQGARFTVMTANPGRTGRHESSFVVSEDGQEGTRVLSELDLYKILNPYPYFNEEVSGWRLPKPGTILSGKAPNSARQTTPAVAEQSAPNLDEQGALDEAVDQGEADVTQDPLYKEFAELHVATSKAEKQSDPSDWTPAMKAADKAGDWREFSRLRGYTDQEIEQFGRYLEVSNQLVDKYGADAVQSEAVALDEENGAVDVEGAAQAVDDAPLPKDIRGVKMTEKNRPLLDAYFTDEIAALQKKQDGKGKTERLAQLERQALRVGFSQADVDQMFGRQQAEQSRLTEPKVTRSSPPADPNANWSPTVTLDYGDYTIENDGTAAVYSLKTPAELSSTAKLTGIAAGNDRITLLAENSSGERVNVRIRKDHIRLEKPSSAAMRDYEFDGSNSADLDRLLGSELVSRLDAAKPEERVGMVLDAVTQKLGLDNLERFSAEFDNMRQGQPASASAKSDAKPATKTESQQATDNLKDALANLGDVLTDALGTKKNITGQRYTMADVPDALVKVMKALIKAGYTQFKDAAAEVMKRMRANKDWAPLADRVDQGMLLKAWNAAGGDAKQAAASTLRSQTRAVKTSKGDQLITNQNPINARQFYMSPEEVAENQRVAEDLKSGETTPAKNAVANATDEDGRTFQRASGKGGRKQSEPKKEALPKGQLPLGISAPRQQAGEPEIVKRLRSSIERRIREITNASFYEDSIRQLQKRLTEIDERLRAMDTVEVQEGKRTVKFSARQDGDENPGLWGQQDENAYDRFEGGMVYDKASPKNELLEQRRKISADLDEVRKGSIRGKARLYRIGMDRIGDYVIRRAEAAIKGGADPEVVRAAVRPYLEGIAAIRDAQARPQEQEEVVDASLEEANRNLSQRDFFEGERVAAGILADFKAKRINQRELEDLEQRGMREGDFTLTDLLNAYRAIGISPHQRLYAGLKHFSVRTRLKDYVAQQGGRMSAVDAYFLDMAKVQSLVSKDQFERLYTLKERGQLMFWQEDRREILGRTRVTQAMRESSDPRIAFKGFLFTRITLEEARNPDAIRNTTLRQTLTGLFDNLEEAWFQDVAMALRRRPSLANGLFDYRADAPGVASVVMEGVLSPQEQQAFRQWVDKLKAGAQKQAEVLARVPYFEAIRNNGMLDAVRTSEGAPMVASTPEYDEVVTLTAPVEDVSPQSLMDEATQAIEAFASAQRIKTTDIQRIEGADRAPSGRGFSRYTFVLKDGRRLIGEQLQLFAGGPLSTESGYGIAVPEVMNAALKNDLQAVYRLFEGSDSRTRARTRSQSFYLSAEPDLFLERSAGRPSNPPTQYERLYVQIVNGEFDAVQQLMDLANRFKAMQAGMVDMETGEILTQQQADELAAEVMDSIMMNAQMESSYDQYGNEMGQYGARVRGDDKVVRTIEEAAERDAQIGGQADVSLMDMSSEEQIQEGALSEFEGETQELSGPDSEVETGAGAEQGPAAEQEDERQAKGRRIPMSLEGGPEYRFRRGPAWDVLSGAIVQDIVNRLTSGWKNASNVVVLPNAQHLPESIRSQVIEKLAGNGAKGLYHDGTVYLFSQHLDGDADVEFTLFHEAYGHLGMRAVLGEKFDQFLETAYRTRPEVREAADALIADGMPKLEAIDEVLSDMAGGNRNVSIVKQWVGKIISGLREIGLARVADWFASMTDAEVASTLVAARDAVRNGTLPAMNGAPSEIRFKEVRPPYEVFATKDGKTTGYARYNPVTDSWAVFSADGANIKDGYTTTTTQDFDGVVKAMKHRGKVEYRLRSGLFVDDKIVADLVELPKFNDTKKYSIWDPRRWAQLRRLAQLQFQNEYLPVFEVIEYLESKGRITPQTDVKTALMLYERRAGYLVEQFRKRFAEPIQKLVEQAGKLGVTKKDIDRYLTARHAFERNAVIASINPEMPDGGSGLTNQQADEILRAVRSSPAGQVLEEIGRLTDTMGREKVDYLSKTGMITKKLTEKLRGYDHYINLSGEAGAELDADDPGLLAGGSKFNVKGKERRALGRGEGNEASDVLSRTMQGFEAALIRGQKNIVAQKVLALIETNYSAAFATVNRQAYKKQFNPETGEVEEVLDENYMARKDVMVAKVGGIPTTIEFKERGLGTFADAIHGMVSPAQSGPIMEGVGKVSRFLGALLTTYNPAFTLVNFTRDVQTMYLNAASDGKISQKMARDMIKALPTAIMAAIHEASGGRLGRGANADTLRVLREMQREGGITYFADRKNLEDQVRKLDDLLSGKKYPMQETFQKIGGVMEFLADISEIAPRLAAYKVVRENGFSKEQAAVFSGDITVNFNMRGANKEVRQLYVFFNPAVQGSYKLYKLATTKEGQKQFAKMAMALTAFGFLTSLLGRAVSGEDDDGIDNLDKVPVYKRATSVVLAADVPGGAPLPIPYGWNAFFATGVFMADTVLGKQPLSVTAGRIAKTTAEAFSPIGMGASDAKTFETFAAKFVAPTVLLPGVEFLANENRFGAPVRKEQSPFDASKTPDAQQYFRGVSPISRTITDGLTAATGGNKYKAGGIDVNPATIDFLIQSYLPGLPSDAYKGASAAVKAASGEEVKRAPWPLLDRFSARIPTGYDAGAYRRAAEMVETVYQEYSKTRDQGRRQEIRAEYPRIGYAHAVIASTTQELRQVRKQIADLEERRMPDDQKVARKNQLMDREEAIFRKATKKLMQAGDPVREAMMANE